MIYKDLLHHLTFTFWVGPLRDGLHGFCGTWPRCNSLEWGALERRTRGPAKRGSGSVGDVPRPRFKTPASRCGVTPSCGRHCSSLRGRTIPRRYALPCTPKPHTPPRPTAGFRIKGICTLPEGVQPLSRRKASLYFSVVLARIAGGNAGAGAFLFQSRVSSQSRTNCLS